MDAHQGQQAIKQVNRHLASRGWDGISLVADVEGDDPLDWLLSYEGSLADEVLRGDWDSYLTLDQPPEDFHEELSEKAMEAMEAGWIPYDWGMLPDALWSPERQYGLTSSFDLAGYLTPEGNLLNLSDGAGTRLDHRSIGSTKAMQEFVASGNIRVMPESGYLDIRAEPTEAQYRKIAQYANQRRRQGKGLMVTLAKGLGEYDESKAFYLEDPGTASREYEAFQTPAQIVADIRDFYSRSAEAWARRNCRFANVAASLDVIRGAQDDVLAGKIGQGLRNVYSEINRLMGQCRFDDLKALLLAVRPQNMPKHILLGILTATLPVRAKLGSARARFLDKVENELRERRELTAGTLTGLGQTPEESPHGSIGRFPVLAWVTSNCKFAAAPAGLQKVWTDHWGDTWWKADLKDETFLHYTDRETAQKIVNEKMLRYDLGPVEDAFAVSTRYGMHLPNVQSTHIEAWFDKKPEDIVAVLFTTDLPPAVGRPDEVFWRQNVPLKDVGVISKEEAESLLPATSPVGEMDHVFYDWESEAGRYVKERMAQGNPRGEEVDLSPAQAWVTGNCRFAAKWTYDELMRWYEPLGRTALQDPEVMREVKESGLLSERTIRRLFDTDEGQTNFFFRVFNDRPEVIRRRQEITREEREREEQSKRDDYYYHVLPARALSSVMKHGLRPGRPALMQNYSDYSRGKLFLTEKGGVPFWKWRVQDHYGYQTEDHDAPTAVVRARKSDVQDAFPDEAGTQDARIESYYVTSPIPPDHLEVVEG